METSNATDGNAPWDIQAARNLYNIHRWGAEYFDINEAGHVVAKPLRDAGASVDLTDVIEEAKGRGLKFPLLIRFQDILRHRVESINLAFRNCDCRVQLSGQISRRLPDQSEPVARGGGRDSGCRASRSSSAWKSAASRSCSPGWPCKTSSAA